MCRLKPRNKELGHRDAMRGDNSDKALGLIGDLYEIGPKTGALAILKSLRAWPNIGESKS